MNNVVHKVTKKNTFAGILVCSAVAIVSNFVFNEIGDLFFNANTVNNANNVIDVAQLAAYYITKVKSLKRLNSFDIPFIVGGIVAIIS